MKRIQRRNFLFGGLSASALLASRGEAQLLAAAPSALASETAIPRAAATAIEDMLVYAAKIKPGQRVLIAAYLDGLYGGDNLVDRDVIHWVATRGGGAWRQTDRAVDRSAGRGAPLAVSGRTAQSHGRLRPDDQSLLRSDGGRDHALPAVRGDGPQAAHGAELRHDGSPALHRLGADPA